MLIHNIHYETFIYKILTKIILNTSGVIIMTSEILEIELTQKKYSIENLEDHITNFVEVQDKPTTQDTYKNGLTKFYNYLKDNDINTLTLDNANRTIRIFLTSYLGLKVDKIKKLNNSKPEPKYIEFEEVQGLINTVQYITGNLEQITRDKAIICTLFTGGLRISELLNIKLEDYFTTDGTYFTTDGTSYLKITGKGRAEDTKEVIAIPEDTKNLINDYLKQRRDHKRTCQYLFCNNNDNQLTRQAVNKEIKKIANEYDRLNNTNIAPRVSTHTFRHSLARYCLVNRGLPINQVKDLLRHSNIETTAKYLTTSQEEITEIRKGIIF